MTKATMAMIRFKISMVNPPFFDRNIRRSDLDSLHRIISSKFDRVNHVSLPNSRNGGQFRK
jgi:hypothetical protein